MTSHLTLGELLTLPALADATVIGHIDETAAATPIEEFSLDSRELTAQSLFAAVPGTRVHGARFATNAPGLGVVTDAEGAQIIGRADKPIIVVDNVRSVLGPIAAAVHGYPSQKLTLIGVTGTSGKTTTTYLLEAGLMACGYKVGLIGTTGTRINGRSVPTSLTTPEATTLQALFERMLDDGITHVVMEVSSHALSLGRVAAAEFDVAGFTNLSQDHLDFHPTMEDYFEAKAAFFDPESPQCARQAVVVVDDEWGRRMSTRAGQAMTVSTTDQPADVTGTQIDQDAAGAQTIEITVKDTSYTTTIPLPGDFNIANACLATGLAAAVGADLTQFVHGLSHVYVPGRMERIDQGQDFLAVVDYAHKPAAVSAVLKTLHGQVDGRIAVVVGCGGDRDSSKRPIMGAEAAKGADLVVVTDDNPRTEDPAPIRQAVIEGARKAVPDADIREFADRAEAIDEAIGWAQPGDAVVVVGKGHEVGQIIGDEVRHFDDREEVRRSLTQRGYTV